MIISRRIVGTRKNANIEDSKIQNKLSLVKEAINVKGYLARMDSGSPVPRTMASKWVSSNVSMLERKVITSGIWNLEHCPRPAHARLYGQGERAKMRRFSWDLRFYQFNHVESFLKDD